MRAGIIIVLLLCCASPGAAQKAPLGIKDLDERQSALVLAGMAYGIGTANFFARMEGRGFYCPPREVLTTPALIREIASEQLEGVQKPDVIAIAVIDGLRRRYPCR